MSPKGADLIGPMGPDKGDIDMESKEENKIENNKVNPSEVNLKLDDTMRDECDITENPNDKKVIWQDFYTAEDMKHFQTFTMMDMLKNLQSY